MEPIPEELVEETWQEVSSFASGRMIKEMGLVSKSQPELLAFMMEFVQDLDQEVKELAVYMFYVIFRMFQKSSRKRIKEISTESIIECYEKNEDLIQSLEGIHQKFLDRIARIQLSSQPYVMKYVVETLIDAPEEEDPVALTEEDTGFLFLLLKTVVDVLDKEM
jgi:hypothetical protein